LINIGVTLEALMLREELTKISKIADETECASELENLKQQYEHSVSIVKSAIPLREFNCFEYALGLSDIEIYRNMKKKLTYAGFGGVFCNSYFIRWLMDNKLISSHGDLIIYESIYGDLYHAGISTDKTRVLSKWGSGCIYNHKKLEVPFEYGTMPLSYNKPNAKDALQYFKNYLNELILTIKNLPQ
jgi:hypothetical protein